MKKLITLGLISLLCIVQMSQGSTERGGKYYMFTPLAQKLLNAEINRLKISQSCNASNTCLRAVTANFSVPIILLDKEDWNAFYGLVASAQRALRTFGSTWLTGTIYGGLAGGTLGIIGGITTGSTIAGSFALLVGLKLGASIGSFGGFWLGTYRAIFEERLVLEGTMPNIWNLDSRITVQLPYLNKAFQKRNFSEIYFETGSGLYHE